MSRVPTPAPERFWPKVQKTDTCWLWTAAKDRQGYGQFRAEPLPAQMMKAHRFAYEQAHGAIPVGMQIDHLCRVPSCVRPDHLEPVTPAENTRRGISPPAINARQQLCRFGHEMAMQSNGKRLCKTCRNEHRRRTRPSRAMRRG